VDAYLLRSMCIVDGVCVGFNACVLCSVWFSEDTKICSDLIRKEIKRCA